MIESNFLKRSSFLFADFLIDRVKDIFYHLVIFCWDKLFDQWRPSLVTNFHVAAIAYRVNKNI